MKIVVTGASKGIGYELVKEFSRQGGHEIIAIARDLKKLTELQQICEADDSTSIEVYPIDLISDKYPSDFLEKIQTWNQVDLLINNAGLLINKAFIELENDDWESIFVVNVFGVAALIKSLHPYLKNSPNAHIVNIGSMGGIERSSKFKGLSAYSASKAALANLTECLAEEFKEDGIHCNCLCLGAVDTEMLRMAFPDYEATTKSHEMAKLIADFATDFGKMMNGKIIPISASTP